MISPCRVWREQRILIVAVLFPHPLLEENLFPIWRIPLNGGESDSLQVVLSFHNTPTTILCNNDMKVIK